MPSTSLRIISFTWAASGLSPNGLHLLIAWTNRHSSMTQWLSWAPLLLNSTASCPDMVHGTISTSLWLDCSFSFCICGALVSQLSLRLSVTICYSAWCEAAASGAFPIAFAKTSRKVKIRLLNPTSSYSLLLDSKLICLTLFDSCLEIQKWYEILNEHQGFNLPRGETTIYIIYFFIQPNASIS